jgi:hydroxypyruvate reductase
VSTYENVFTIENFDVFGAGHPLPDAAGLQAAKYIAERLKNAQQGELVLILVSGGGSALLPFPVPTITLAEKIDTTNLLLASGANINEINCVRKHLSQLKGGGMAKLAADADLHALILSDVLGDDVSTIASGPTVADDSYFDDAIRVLKSYNVWENIPVSVQNHLQLGKLRLYPETPKTEAEFFKNKSYTIIGSNAISVDAACNYAKKEGFATDLYSKHLCGEARSVAKSLVHYAKNLQSIGLKQATAIIAGGETTVTLSNDCGKGGRNQELALAFALAAEELVLSGDWVFLSAGTDGRDGPTDAAGAIVDGETLKRMRLANINPLEMLNRHDAYNALKAANNLYITGATGTNVADLQILLLNPIHE